MEVMFQWNAEDWGRARLPVLAVYSVPGLRETGVLFVLL